MNGVSDDVVVGVFGARGQAAAVASRLFRLGLAEPDVAVGVPAPGSYRLDVREAETLGTAALNGILVGTLVGAVLGAILLAVAVPQSLELGAKSVVLGLLMGGFWGSFFGGLGGMAIAAVANEGDRAWCEIPERSAAVLVIAHAGGYTAAARKVMRQNGAEALLKDAPDLLPGDTMTTSGSPDPGRAGLLSLGGSAHAADNVAIVDTRSAHGETDGHSGGLSVPRGAFLLIVLFLVAASVLWANVYLRVVWRV